jgi:hypothetical protein
MKPLHGKGAVGKGVDPHELPEEKNEHEGPPRSAPHPGVPVSDEEFERMKKAARETPAPHPEHAQEDCPDPESKSD